MKFLYLLNAFLLACNAKPAAKEASKRDEADKHVASSTEIKSPPDTPIFRSPLATRTRGDRHGNTSEWQAEGGIKITGESYREVYASGGSHFVAFKAKVTVGNSDCLLDWRADLIDSNAGRGQVVSTLSGLPSLRAKTTTIVSGIAALSSEDLAKVGSASVGYWTVCGDAVPKPSALDISIIESKAENIRFGNAFDLHHTVVRFTSLAKGTTPATRCYFDIVIEDRDADGFTLNRDFASVSLRPGAPGVAKIRRTSFEGGRESDYEAAVASKTTYVRDLFCEGPWQATQPEPKGIEIHDLKLRPHTGAPSSAEQLMRASFGHEANLRNTMGKDCAFRVRYRILDSEGLAMNKAPILSETLHLRKGAKLQYVSSDERLYVWSDQAAQVGSLVVEKAEAIDACQSFRKDLALGAPSP